MKILWSILGAFLITIFTLDLGTVYVTYNKLNKVLEKSLDDALIAGTKESDVQLGEIYIDENEANLAAMNTFKDNLKLDDNYENDILKETAFRMRIIQGTKPYAEGEASTVITALSPKLVGLEGFPVKIRKINHQLSSHK
jgi:hypothetical protein